MSKDKIDQQIIELVEKNKQGINLFNINKALDWNLSNTRYRLLVLALDGEIRVEHGRNMFMVYPATKNGGAV